MQMLREPGSPDRSKRIKRRTGAAGLPAPALDVQKKKGETMRTVFPSFDSVALGVGPNGNLQVLGGRLPKPKTRDEDTLYLAAWQAWCTGRWMIPSYNHLPFSRFAPGGYLKVALGNGHGDLQAVGLGADHQIYPAAWMDPNGNWHEGDNKPLGDLSQVKITDLVVANGNDDLLQVVALADTQQIYLAAWLDNKTGLWLRHSRPIGRSDWKWTAMAMARGGDNALQVVTLGLNGNVYLAAYQDIHGGWHNGFEKPLRPENWTFSQVALGKGNDGHLQVVGLAKDREIYLAAYQQGNDWHEPEMAHLSPGDFQYQTVALGMGRYQSLEVIGLGQEDRKVYRAAWQKNSDWHDGSTTPLDSRTYRQVAVGSSLHGDLQVVGLADDGQLYVAAWQDASGTWRPGQPLSQKDDAGRWNKTRLVDVPRAFAAINDHTDPEVTYEAFTPPKYPFTVIESHFQGMARYDGYYLLTHNTEGPDPSSYGRIDVFNIGKKRQVLRFDTAEKDYRHPGGCQIVGDYLGVELELENKEMDAVIRFYWLGSMCDVTLPTLMPSRFMVPRDVGGVSALAITDVGRGANRRYLMALRTGKGITFFTPNDCGLDDPELHFTELFTFPESGFPVIDGLKHGPDNMYLLTQDSGKADDPGNVYLITLGGNEKKPIVEVTDWADVYQVDITSPKPSMSYLTSKHMFTSSGTGALGIHFRYGAGCWVASPSHLDIYCASRNPYFDPLHPLSGLVIGVDEFKPKRG